MKDISDTLKYKDVEYKLVFDLNVMEELQEKYGTFDKWCDEAYGKNTGEPSIKALAFVITAMINEGIEIENEDSGMELKKPITTRKANRILSELAREIGLSNIVNKIDKVMTNSLQGGENSKNE